MARRAVIIASALVLVLVAAAAGYRATASSPRATALGPRATLLHRLHAAGVSVRWVRCTATGRRFEGRTVVRCNADMGDPHIPAYCMVRVAGAWVDAHAGRRVPCRPDWAGWHIITTSSG